MIGKLEKKVLEYEAANENHNINSYDINIKNIVIITLSTAVIASH